NPLPALFCRLNAQLLERSARALAISSSSAAGSCACVPTLSDPVTYLPSTTAVGTDWMSKVCACCRARFILPEIANELYTSSTFLRSSPLLAAQSKNVLSFQRLTL